MKIDLDYEKVLSKIEQDRKACLVHLSDLVRLHPEKAPPGLIDRLTLLANSNPRGPAYPALRFPLAGAR
jgi:hypothetical protein